MGKQCGFSMLDESVSDLMGVKEENGNRSHDRFVNSRSPSTFYDHDSLKFYVTVDLPSFGKPPK